MKKVKAWLTRLLLDRETVRKMVDHELKKAVKEAVTVATKTANSVSAGMVITPTAD